MLYRVDSWQGSTITGALLPLTSVAVCVLKAKISLKRIYFQMTKFLLKCKTFSSSLNANVLSNGIAFIKCICDIYKFTKLY